MVENDADALEKMKAILGNKKSARSIVIKDKVNIILQKFSPYLLLNHLLQLHQCLSGHFKGMFRSRENAILNFLFVSSERF